jgi:hypothetical protein
MKKRYAALAALATFFVGYSIGKEPVEPDPVEAQTIVETKTETVYVDRPVEVIKEVPAELPESCEKLTYWIDRFHGNVSDLGHSAGQLERQAHHLHREAVVRDGQAMVKTKAKMDEHIEVLERAAVDHGELLYKYQNAYSNCKQDLGN